MPFRFKRLEIPDLILVEPAKFLDARGYFMETYKYSAFKEIGIEELFLQDNCSYSKKGVLRGLHYQVPPKAQAKLVKCLRGKIFDVAVDIRRNSPTFGRWVGVILSGEEANMLYIPVGFAHGFLVLSEEAEVLYKVSNEYAPECERGIIWNDPQIGINWGIEKPVLSEKDKKWPTIKEAELF